MKAFKLVFYIMHLFASHAIYELELTFRIDRNCLNLTLTVNVGLKYALKWRLCLLALHIENLRV